MFVLFSVFPDLLRIIPASIHVSVILFCTVLIVFALVGAGFFMFNAFGSPYETLHGPVGLYLWSFISCEYQAGLGWHCQQHPLLSTGGQLQLCPLQLSSGRSKPGRKAGGSATSKHVFSKLKLEDKLEQSPTRVYGRMGMASSCRSHGRRAPGTQSCSGITDTPHTVRARSHPRVGQGGRKQPTYASDAAGSTTGGFQTA